MKLRFRLAFMIQYNGQTKQRAYDDLFDFPDIGLGKPIYNSEFTGVLTPVKQEGDDITFVLDYYGQKTEGVLKKDGYLDLSGFHQGTDVHYRISYEQ